MSNRSKSSSYSYRYLAVGETAVRAFDDELRLTVDGRNANKRAAMFRHLREAYGMEFKIWKDGFLFMVVRIK